MFKILIGILFVIIRNAFEKCKNTEIGLMKGKPKYEIKYISAVKR